MDKGNLYLGVERRSEQRLDVRIPLEYTVLDSKNAKVCSNASESKPGSGDISGVNTETENFSAGGLLMITTRILPLGAVIRVKLFPPGFDQVNALAKVIRVEKRDNAGFFYVAVQFIEEEVRKELHELSKYIARELDGAEEEIY